MSLPNLLVMQGVELCDLSDMLLSNFAHCFLSMVAMPEILFGYILLCKLTHAND